MLNLPIPKTSDGSLRLLVLGAHCDDIEIGCGGTVLMLASQFSNLSVRWIVLSSTSERAREGNTTAERFLSGVQDSHVSIESFRDGYFPYDGASVKDYFEDLKRKIDPDLILTHFRDDWHQDHRVVCELTWNTFRDHLILEYEVPKYDPDLGSPNVFVHLDEATVEDKIRYILEGYVSQTTRHWFTRDTFLSMMRLRGLQSAAQGRYAEAFYLRKAVLGSLLASDTA